MIKSIAIKNFQSHRNTEINFSDGLNVITGSSDSGKSSVIRAIRWVVENRPSGDSIRNWKTDRKEKVSVEIEAGNSLISKERIGRQTKYILNTNSFLKEFEAVRSDVPKEISEAFSLSEFNLQTQHDPYFLLNDSPGEVAKKLNALVGLDIIDIIFKNLNSKTVSLKREIEENISSGNSLITQINELSWIDLAESRISEIEEIESEILKQKEVFEKVLEISETVRELKKKTEESQPILQKEKTVEELLSVFRNLQKEREKAYNIQKLIENVLSLKGRISEVSLSESVKNNFFALKEEIENFVNRKTDCENTLRYASAAKEYTKEKKKQESITISKTEELISFISQNRICPLCKSKLDDKKIKEML